MKDAVILVPNNGMGKADEKLQRTNEGRKGHYNIENAYTITASIKA